MNINTQSTPKLQSSSSESTIDTRVAISIPEKPETRQLAPILEVDEIEIKRMEEGPYIASTDAISSPTRLIDSEMLPKFTPRLYEKKNRIQNYITGIKDQIWDYRSRLKSYLVSINYRRTIHRCCSAIPYYTSILSYISNYIGCIVITILLIISIFKRDHPDSADAAIVLEYMAWNSNSIPFVDLYLSNSNTCKTGYELSNFGKWPGTVNGCLNTNNNTLYRYQCQNTNSAFQNIPYTSPQNITLWKNNTFCLKRAKNYYVGENCPGDYIACASGICFSQRDGCPITDIQISSENYKIFNEDGIESNKIILPIDNKTNLYMYIEKSTNKVAYPVVNLTYGYNIVCLERNRISSSTPNTLYPLLNIKSFDCGKFGQDPLTQVIDFDYEYNLHAYNGIISAYTNLLGLKNSSINQIAFLFTISKLRLKPNLINSDCLMIFKINFETTSDSLVYYEFITFKIVIVACSFHISNSIWGVYIGIQFKRKNPSLRKKVFISVIIGMVIDTTCFIFVITAKNNANGPILSYPSLNCFADEIFNQALVNYQLVYNALVYYYNLIIAMFCCSVAFLVPFISYLILLQFTN